MLDGAKFWIGCKRPVFLSSFCHLQMIQNLAPSTIVWRQCYIQIAFQQKFWWSADDGINSEYVILF